MCKLQHLTSGIWVDCELLDDDMIYFKNFTKNVIIPFQRHITMVGW